MKNVTWNENGQPGAADAGGEEREEHADTRNPDAAGQPEEETVGKQEEETAGQQEEATPEIEGWDDDKKPAEEGTNGEGQPEEPNTPVVSIKGLRKSFKDHEVLKGVDLHVNKGENLVVLGKSGSGKSVLIKCLVRLEWPDEGELKVFGKDIATLSYDELNEMRLRTGFLFQNAALYDSMTVGENLAFPLKQHKKKVAAEKKEELIMEMLDNVGLADAIDQMPSKLSGGQAKRIGLARTLILRPELMLYDEPTTGLDTGTAKEISELMIKMKNKYNISSITITHDMACARMTADRIIMMKEGVVVAEGNYSELEKSDDEWIKSFFS
jgi:phospholipid/cholesterol/gamma-HCH transport system ATP-binding protein